MKNLWKVSIVCSLIFSLLGCRSQTTNITQANDTPVQTVSLQDKKVLIAYFTRAENVVIEDGMDTTTAASTMMKEDKMVGNTGYVAEIIQEQVNGTLYPVKMIHPYATEYDDTLPREEQNEQVRPEIEQGLSNAEDYDVIFLGYPNWWHDMPMAFYTFLENNNFDGKVIIPFVSYGASKLSNNEEILRKLYPNAIILEELEISQDDILNSEDIISNWLERVVQ